MIRLTKTSEHSLDVKDTRILKRRNEDLGKYKMKIFSANHSGNSSRVLTLKEVTRELKKK